MERKIYRREAHKRSVARSVGLSTPRPRHNYQPTPLSLHHFRYDDQRRALHSGHSEWMDTQANNETPDAQAVNDPTNSAAQHQTDGS